MPRSFLYLFVLLAAALAAGAATAADMKVIISAGFFNVYADLGPAFEKLTGHKLITTRGPSVGDSPEAIPTRLTRGEGADVVIMDGTGVDLLDQRGMLAPAAACRSRSRSSAWWFERVSPSPTSARSRRCEETLLAAKSIAYSDSSSGTYLSTIGFKKTRRRRRDRRQDAQGAWTAFGGTGGCSRCSRRGGGRLPTGLRANSCPGRRFRRHGAVRHSTSDLIRRCAAEKFTATRFSSCATSFPVLRGGGRRHHESWTEAVGSTVNGRFHIASPSERGVARSF